MPQPMYLKPAEFIRFVRYSVIIGCGIGLPQPMITDYRTKRINSAGLRYILSKLEQTPKMTNALPSLQKMSITRLKTLSNLHSLTFFRS